MTQPQRTSSGQGRHRTARVLGRSALAGLAAGALLAAEPAGAAAARYYVFSDATNCIENQTNFDVRSDRPWGEAIVHIWSRQGSGGSCPSAWFEPPGYLALRYEVWKHTGPGPWDQALCVANAPEWLYNTASAWEWTIYTGNGFANGQLCGPGEYGTWGSTYARRNGAWIGDHLWSGYESVPVGK